MRCVLGPAKNEVNETTQWIFNENEKIIPRQTVKKLVDEHLSPSNDV